MRERGSAVFNLLSLLLVGLTAVTLLGYLVVLVHPGVFFNPFPPQIAQAPSPSPSPTSTSALPPTYTPTSTPTPTATRTATPTRTPTGTPTITPTWPPTPTPTPRATRSPFPFTCEVLYQENKYSMPWSGVAGHVQDLDGKPLPGYHVAVQCPGIPQTFDRVAGADERYNLMYENEAAWEQVCDPTRYQQMEIRVQLFNKRPNPDGTYQAVAPQVTVELGDWYSRSLGYVVCTLNWENWQ